MPFGRHTPDQTKNDDFSGGWRTSETIGGAKDVLVFLAQVEQIVPFMEQVPLRGGLGLKRVGVTGV
ncbi:hypothetical protein COO92_18025 [Thalassospira lohafexi]|uniref:Uncharacterized protein n=1 Tax=Thalassospira lohafexi TaxID=744227 RepID=A0A2N3L2B9_9PROT|nr:hypothetical protein COO92_18025 [Thalassospira lohafexi]